MGYEKVIEKRTKIEKARKDVMEAKAKMTYTLMPTNKIVRPDESLRDLLFIDDVTYSVTKRFGRGRFMIKAKERTEKKLTDNIFIDGFRYIVLKRFNNGKYMIKLMGMQEGEV